MDEFLKHNTPWILLLGVLAALVAIGALPG
jgi:hypothetical protein